MEIKKPAIAGTQESSDCQITIRPNPEQGVEIDLNSDVKLMFGDSILNTVKCTLQEFGVQNACVEIWDKGAIDCVIQARMRCAICRAAGEKYDWTKEDYHG